MRTTPPPRPLLLPGRALRAGARRVVRRPAVSLALGLSLVLGAMSSACGIGLLLAPWFSCELLALHLRAGGVRGAEHHRGWLAAWLVQAAALALVGLGGVLGALWLAGLDGGRGASPAALREALPGFVGAAVGLVAMVPWLFAPLVLLDRGGTVPFALYQSARLVTTAGLARALAFSLAVHAAQGLPVLAALAVRLLLPDRSPGWAVLAAVATAAVALPVGQGAVAEAYLQRRDEVGTPGRAGERRAELRGLQALLAAAAVLLPLLSAVVIVGSVLARPATAAPGRAPRDGVVLLRRSVRPEGDRLPVEGTTLTVLVGPRRLAVVAADGGGAGRVPLPTGFRAERVRLVRRGEHVWIEARDGRGASVVVVVDEAGVRLDDGLRRRLAERLPPWAGLLFALSLVLGGVAMSRALAPLGELARRESLPEPLRPCPEALEAAARRVRRRLWRLLVPWLGCGGVAAWLAARAATG